MKAMSIKGKDYIPVNERLKEFRNNSKYEGFSLTSEIVKFEESQIVVKAMIHDASGRLIATGHAEEFRSDDFKNVNSTSALENAETSAFGRALGNLGIGIETSVATADEVMSAIEKQETMTFRRAMPAQPRQVQRVVSQPQQLNTFQHTDSVVNKEENYPKYGDEGIIDGVACIVRRNKNNGELFWAAKDPNVKYTSHIGPERR